MAVRTLTAVQKIPASMEEVWKLISDPANLSLITPADMRFRVISVEKVNTIYPGQFIEYKVSPLFRIPLYWKTEIMDVKKEELFIDEQRKGPYRLWRHEHYFKAIPGGVEMRDLVKYENPFGIFGRWANSLLVRKKLLQLFHYRYRKIEEIFGVWDGQKPEIHLI